MMILGRIVAIAVYCYTRSAVVGRSVCVFVCVCVYVCMYVGHVLEPCKNGWTDRDAVLDEDSVGPKYHVTRIPYRSERKRVCLIKTIVIVICTIMAERLHSQNTPTENACRLLYTGVGLVHSEINICIYEKSAIQNYVFSIPAAKVSWRYGVTLQPMSLSEYP